jgi:hypothetical protein
MNRELFLARRIIEAAADPYASPLESETAAGELAAFVTQFGETRRRGYPVRVEHFEGVQADDLSPMAWLLLLDNAEWDDPMVPPGVLDQLFQSVEDEVIRFRLVSTTLGHPRISRAYERALELDPAPLEVASLPDCWPKLRLLGLDQLSRSAEVFDAAPPAESLRELLLYLLQDGSPAARALAAAAVAPTESWRDPARELAGNVVRAVDPDLSGYGAPFRRALI